jgi:hypothetical protein
MSNVVNFSLPPADEVHPVYAETLEWAAAVQIIEAALTEFSERLSEDDTMALERAWSRIQQG